VRVSVLDCGSPLPLFPCAGRSKAAEGCRSPKHVGAAANQTFSRKFGLLAMFNHGASRSRWGWWSRFQRLKAASLVSSKRNFNVGDSTWPSQKTALALPATEWRAKIISQQS
jgi:hypothetical protein